jgi:hypothetical protein
MLRKNPPSVFRFVLAAVPAIGIALLIQAPAAAQDCPAEMNPVCINPSGTATGTYTTTSEPFSHGYVRKGAEITPFMLEAQATFVRDITPSGTVLGGYVLFGLDHGFLRDADGTITTFSVPRADGTWPTAINPSGTVTGSFYLYRTPYRSSGFIRNPDGSIITFTIPGGTGFTMPTDINPDGVVTGRYNEVEQYGPDRGFIRAADGTFTTFLIGLRTTCEGINPAGDVVGNCTENSGAHPFVRHADGSVETFVVPGAAFTRAVAINPTGAVTGYYVDPTGQHAFVRSANGNFETVTIPGATSNAAVAISPSGAITGQVVINGCTSAFVRSRFGAITIFNLPSAPVPTDEIVDDGGWRPGARSLTRAGQAYLQLSAPAHGGRTWSFDYSLPVDTDVSLAIYDVAGRSVALLDRGFRTAGAHHVSWAPTGIARGMYFVRLKAGTAQLTKAIAIRD